MNNNELNKRRQELELMLASERTLSDSSKNKLILKLLNLLENELEEVDGDIAKSWRQRFLGYQWEQVRENYFLKHGRYGEAENCRKLAEQYRGKMNEEDIKF